VGGVPRLIHLNGPPGIGKSTLSALLADQHPGTLNLDADYLHRLIGGAQYEETRPWQVVWPLAKAMAATHLDGGRDVVLPQYFARLERITAFEDLAHEHGADFREIVLLDDRAASLARYERRARETDDPWLRHFHRSVERQGCSTALGTMYDDLLDVIRLRPDAVVVPSASGAIQETYERLLNVLREPVP
jgi:predicted kinase